MSGRTGKAASLKMPGEYRTAVLFMVMAFLMNLNAASQSTEPEPDILNEFETWTEFSLNARIYQSLKLHLEPELRFREDFSLDKYLIGTGLSYKPLDFLRLGAGYRFIGNRRLNKDTEYLHRYAFDLGFKKDVKRFKPEFRIRYTNYSDEDLDADYLRYKPELKYDIPNCRITPFISAEAFHRLSINKIEKMRYEAGLDYRLLKNYYIGLSYKFDYYRLEYRNRHILCIGLQVKFK